MSQQNARITLISALNDSNETVRQTPHTYLQFCISIFEMRDVLMLRYRMAGITESAMVAYTHKYAVV